MRALSGAKCSDVRMDVDHPPALFLDRLHGTLYKEQSFVQQQFKVNASTASAHIGVWV